MTNYRRGYLIELKAKKELEKDGYHVTRSAGSHGAFDCVAIGEHDIKCIQLKRAKSGRNLFPELASLHGFKFPSNVSRELWVWFDGKKIWKKYYVRA